MNNLDNNLSEREQAAYKEYMAYWEAQNGLPSSTLKKILENFQNDTNIQEFSRYQKSVKIFFDQSNFRFLYVTENIKDLLGYDVKQMNKSQKPWLFYFLTFEHLGFPLRTTKFSFQVYNKVPRASYLTNLRMCVCGIKVKHFDKSIRRMLMMYRPLDFDKNGIIQTAIITLEDVTHLTKSDFYWGRTSCGENDEYKFHFISDKKTELAQDIISEREKEVLRLIAKGMESKEIGNQLFISSGTVDNHRRNMIARTGARDTTALLQLCIYCGII